MGIETKKSTFSEMHKYPPKRGFSSFLSEMSTPAKCRVNIMPHYTFILFRSHIYIGVTLINGKEVQFCDSE